MSNTTQYPPLKKPIKLDSSALEQELYPQILVDKKQIDAWIEKYNANPDPATHPFIEIAKIFMLSGLHEAGSRYYERFLALHDDRGVHGLYLQNLLLSASSTNQSLLSAHQAFAKKYDKPLKRLGWQRRLLRSKKQKLKIGYLCHFYDSSVAHNALLPFLKLHDKNKFEVYCYDDLNAGPDYHQYADHWRQIQGKSDKEVAKLIAKDGIDILQEANGFCLINRFGALAYRPAPIQINWFNHASTTGLPYIDYAMSDVISIHDGDLPYLTEKAYRHHHFIAAVRFNPDTFGEVVTEPPCVKNGYITFGYFGASHKTSFATIALWSEILKNIPNSKLILKCSAFSQESYQTIFKRHFSFHGIDSSRIEFHGWTDQASTVQKYNEIDIMLDSVPVSGGSTIFENLIQGVPAITLMGERWAARSGASVLTTLNHPELVAKNPADYIHIATTLAQDLSSLREYRKNLRKEMLASPLTNIENYYQTFEKAYLQMWDERWNKRKSA